MPTSSTVRLAAVLAVIVAAMLWGTTGTTQALLPEEREPLVVAALRLLVGAAALLVLAAAQRPSRMGFADLPPASIVAAGAAIALYNVAFFMAVLGAGVGIGTALAIGSAPVWATLLEIVFARRRPSPRQLLGQSLAIGGAALLVLSGTATDATAAGMALGVLAGASYAAYSLITSRISQSAPSASIAAATFSVAALLLAPLLLVLPTAWALTPESWPKLAFLGVVVTGVSYALYTWGLRHVAPSTAVTLALAEPLTAWLLATAVVGETLTAGKIAGAALLLLGLAIVTGAVGRRPVPATP